MKSTLGLSLDDKGIVRVRKTSPTSGDVVVPKLLGPKKKKCRDDSEDEIDKAIQIAIVKSVPLRRQVYGWLAVSEDENGRPVVDADGDYIPVEELEKAAHGFSASGVLGDWHQRMGVGYPIVSLVTTPDVLAAMGLPDAKLQKGWFVGWQVTDDETWRKIESGEYRSFSIGGTGVRV